MVVPINVATNTPGHPIKVGNDPWRIAITPDGTMAYVANSLSETVTPIRVASGTADPPIKVAAPFNLVITPCGKTVYVVDFVLLGTRGWVTPINLSTCRAGQRIPVGRTPIGIAVVPLHGDAAGPRTEAPTPRAART